jgi:Chaperone of endosialidase
MGWSSGVYTKGNSATGGWTGDATSGIGIEAGRHDTQDNDFATGINTCLTKDGQNNPTANLPMAGFKHTGVANGSANTDYMAYGQIRNGTPLYMDTTNNRLGINTSTPSTTLDVQGTTTIANIGRFSADTTAGSLQIQKSRGAAVGTNTIVQSGDEIGAIGFFGANGTSYTAAAAIYAHVDGTPGATNDMPGRLTFYTTADGAGAWSERMRIDNAGNVGIGGTPAWKFDVQGSLNGDFVMRHYNSSNGASANSQIILGNDTNNAAVGIRLNSSANSGLGGANSFNIYQGLNASVSIFTNGTLRHNISNTGIHTMSAYGAGTATFSAAGVISSVSDERLKVKDGSIEQPLEKLKKLEPGYWHWKDEVKEELGDQRELGFFAQNVAAAIGEEAAPTPQDGKRWGYYDRSVLAVAVETIKELNAKIEALEARVAELEK